MSSKIFLFLITTLAMVVQMNFPNSSPLDNHSSNLWIFIACLFLHAFSSAYCKAHASTSNNINQNLYFKLLSYIAPISGSMACVALLTVLVVSKTGLALIVIIYLACLPIYLALNQVTQICKKIGSYVYDKWNGIERTHCNPRANIQV